MDNGYVYLCQPIALWNAAMSNRMQRTSARTSSCPDLLRHPRVESGLVEKPCKAGDAFSPFERVLEDR